MVAEAREKGEGSLGLAEDGLDAEDELVEEASLGDPDLLRLDGGLGDSVVGHN